MKKISAIALAVAGLASFETQAATVAAANASAGTQISIGCTVPSGANGSTVYSADTTTYNAAGAGYGAPVDTVILPAGVTVGGSCNTALNSINQSQAGAASNGHWVQVGEHNATVATGASLVNITVPGTGYSLQSYTFVAQ